MWPNTRLGRVLGKLEGQYGLAAGVEFADPFEMIVWEIVAYLADDAKRALAFRALRERVGLSAAEIADAPVEVLRGVTRMGGAIAAVERADRLRMAAEIVLEKYGGNLAMVLGMPAAKAKRALMEFPMIGEPGAEKILLFSGAHAALAPDSNGLRVLVRLGIGVEGKSYAATYRSVREAALAGLPADTALLKAAHGLLRVHGQRLCTRSAPQCDRCPVRRECPFSG